MDDRLMFVNRLNVQMCNFHTEFDAVGKTCADLFPAHMASIYMERCRQVRTTGRPIIETIYCTGIKITFPSHDVARAPSPLQQGRGGLATSLASG